MHFSPLNIYYILPIVKMVIFMIFDRLFLNTQIITKCVNTKSNTIGSDIDMNFNFDKCYPNNTFSLILQLKCEKN